MYDVSAGSALRLPAATCVVTISVRVTIADCTSSHALALVLDTLPPPPLYCGRPSVTVGS